MSADALYNQGMSFYRRHQWQQAQESFRHLQRLDPGRRGIEALLYELEIFIRLESLNPSALPQELAAPGPQEAGARDGAGRGGGRPRLSRLLPAAVAAAALLSTLALLARGAIGAWAAQPAAELHYLGKAYCASHKWREAVSTYEQLLLLAPADVEARDGLWKAYYEWGDQRTADANSLEERGLYQSAVELWGAALADFRAAREVNPAHEPDPRGDLPRRIAEAERRQRCASLLAQALQLGEAQRWLETIQKLQDLRRQEPDYRPLEVSARLGEALLQGGQDAVTNAVTAPRIQEGVGMIEQALLLQPANAAAEVALAQGRAYLEAVTGIDAHDWDAAVNSLQSMLKQDPDFANGRARELLCLAYVERAGERQRGGKLRQALADYQAVASLECSQQAEAEAKSRIIAASLIPTATPTPLRTATPTPAPALAATPSPGPSPTP